MILEVCGMSSMIKDADEPEWRHCLSIKQIAIREISDVETYEKPNWVDVDNFELMQFTGLKDKNGKEIYEGDIVEHIPKFKTRYEIKYLTSGFYICPIGKDYGENFATLFAGYEEKTNICRSLEIIGNIYESELLKDK